MGKIYVALIRSHTSDFGPQL